MSDSLSNILKDNVLLVGQSPENPNNWVMLDVKKTDAGFCISEQRPASNYLVSSGSGEFAVANWGNFASGEIALEGLSSYLDTHPIYSEYKFSLGEISGSNHSDGYVSNGGETSVRAKRGGAESDVGAKNVERAETISPDNNRLENLAANSIDGSPSRSNINRAGVDEPETESAGGSLIEDVEHWIPSLFESAHKGVSGLRNELENNVDGSNWFGRAIGASALDVMDTAMSFTEGIPLGILDTRQIGEGFAEGTWEGAKKDISRALNVLPQGRLLRAVDRAMTASDVVESLSKEDIKGAGLAVGLAALSMASKGKKGNKSKSIKMEAHFPEGKQTIMVPKKVLRDAAKKSRKLNSNLIGRENKYNTLAVFVAYDPKAKKAFTVVSANKSTVQKKYRDLLDDSTEHLRGIDSIKGTNLHHAEVNGITNLWSNEHGVVLVLPSNNACKAHCLPMLNSWGIPFINPKELKAFLSH